MDVGGLHLIIDELPERTLCITAPENVLRVISRRMK